jgi:enterobacteria phage integrase
VPRKLPKYCERYRDRHGKLRVYFRKAGCLRVALPVDVESDEFREACAQALLAVPRKEKDKPAAPGTIEALVRSYYRCPEFIALRDTSKTGYRSRIEAIREAHGHRTLSGMTRDGIVTKILQPYADRPGQRLAILKTLRILIRHAIEIGCVRRDPSRGIKRPKTKEIPAWTEAEIAQFESRWPIETRERLAFALVLYSGQRRSDVHRMTWADINGDSIRVVQQKTGAKLVIPLHSDLREILAAAARNHVTIMNTEFGKPFTVDGFSCFMRDAIKSAGMAVLGHKSLSEAERYTRDADQKQLAEAAIIKLEKNKRDTELPNHDSTVRQKSKKAKQNQSEQKGLALPGGLEPLFPP